MRLGLLTYHNANNFGAALQAYALEKFLSNNMYASRFYGQEDVYLIMYVNIDWGFFCIYKVANNSAIYQIINRSTTPRTSSSSR